MKIYYSTDYTAAQFAFDTTRKSSWVAETAMDDPRFEIVPPNPDLRGVTSDIIGAIHDPAYVEAVRTGTPEDLASSQGFPWDPGIYTMAFAHSHGLISALHSAAAVVGRDCVAGSLSSGLHHARYTHGAGFCTFNGLAAVAWYAYSVCKMKKILVLDFDAHCGGGTNDIAHGFITQVDVSTNHFDHYVPGYRHRQFMATPSGYDSAVRAALTFASTSGPWDLIIYNAGMDPIDDGVSFKQLQERERCVAQWVRKQITEHATPAVFALAGGYTGDDRWAADIVDLHMLTLNAWAGLA